MHMLILLFLVVVLLFILLTSVSAIVPVTSNTTTFELNRMANAGSEAAKFDLKRDELAQDIGSVVKILSSLLLVLIVVLSISVFGWFFGTIVAIAAGFSYAPLGRLPYVRKRVAGLYGKYEVQVLDFVAKHQKVVWWLRSVAPEISDVQIHSKDELEHLVQNAGHVLTDDQKKLLLGSLAFDTRVVHDSMTPRTMIESIKKSEMLGPLVLDALHKSGHSRFPVIANDIDHIVGTLYLRDVLKIDSARKYTATVETAMDKHVYYIHEDQTLVHALNAFLKTHHHLFIVINEFRETVGILSLEDTMEALLGKKIVDEFDDHDDLRAVAARKAKSHRASSIEQDV